MEENPGKAEYADDDEINLIDYVKVVWKRRKLIIGIVVVVVIATTIYAFLQPKIYEATAVISPVGGRTDLGAMSAVAASFGLAAPAAANVTEVVNVLKSDILKDRIVKKYNLLPVLFEKDAFNGKTEDQKSWTGIKTLQGILKVNYAAKDNTITISAQYKDPKIAADLIKYTLEELTERMSSEARRVSETNQKYLESQVDKTLDPFIRTKIYTMVAQQIETSMMAEVKENFAFKIIDPPRVPVNAIKPKKRQMVMISFVVSLFLGIFAAFGKEYFVKIKEKGFK
ncbi:MAG: Wzz/FepE/Etk N-terminal domain-containing protein [Deltaproteobacteria bacterium]